MAEVGEEGDNFINILESAVGMGIVSLAFVIIGMVDSHTIWGNETGWMLAFFVLLIHTYFANRKANHNFTSMGIAIHWLSKNIDDEKKKEFLGFFQAIWFVIGLESKGFDAEEIIKNTPQIITNYIDENASQVSLISDIYDDPDFDGFYDEIMDLVRVSKENE